jgi:glycosyltransferase involved in cell wall biosynthesis
MKLQKGNLHLVLFFTKGVSLENWAQNGSLEREIAFYLRLQERGVKVSFLTYGRRQDLQYLKRLQGINILSNRWNFPNHWYEKLVPFLHASALRHADVYKSNQTNGAEIALRAARFWHKPFIARCGYMWSEFAEFQAKQEEYRQANQIEKLVFSRARKVIVTTPEMQKYAINHYTLEPEKVTVIPNFVLVDLFSKANVNPQSNRICFVGRMSEQKNLFSLLEACKGLDIELVLIGEGPLRTSLQDFARQSGINVTMPGNIPHHQLPDAIRQSAIFALVSYYEGHPKVLLEAMACGLCVLGTESPGIREQIIHGETGWLVRADAESIRAGIQHLLATPQLRTYLGDNARRMILETYSLDKIVGLEMELLKGFRKL